MAGIECENAVLRPTSIDAGDCGRVDLITAVFHGRGTPLNESVDELARDAEPPAAFVIDEVRDLAAAIPAEAAFSVVVAGQ